MGICAFCYMCNLFGVVMLHRSMVDWRGDICLWYMCILLYVQLIQCSGFPEIYAQLGEGVHLHWVWPHCSVGYTGLV